MGCKMNIRFLLIVVTSAAGCFSAFAADLSVGFARVDITPPLGSYMPGYFIDRRAKEVLDPLQINCIAFSDGKERALFLQFDTEELSDEVADAMRDAIVAKTGVKRDAILLHSSHTHDGGYLAIPKWTPEGCKDPFATDVDYIYVKMTITRVVDAAVNALADLKPARLSCGRSVAKRITFGRRYLMKNGKVRTNPGTNNPDIVRPVGNPPDEEVQVLRIDRDGGKSIAVINFQTHPDVVGGETFTADWPGLARTIFEAATLGETEAMVVNGTEGDVNHCNVQPRPGEQNGLKTDFDDVERGYEHARHMANVIVSAVLSVWLKCVPLDSGDIRYGTTTVRVGSNRAKESDEKNVAWADKVWGLHEAGKDVELPWRGMELTTEVARARRIRNLREGPDYFDLPLTSFAIGQSVAFGGFPGEPFNDIGKAVKKRSPFKMTILACLTNASRGYFPFSDSFKEDGYEAASSVFGPTVADDLIRGQLDLLNSLLRR